MVAAVTGNDLQMILSLGAISRPVAGQIALLHAATTRIARSIKHKYLDKDQANGATSSRVSHRNTKKRSIPN